MCRKIKSYYIFLQGLLCEDGATAGANQFSKTNNRDGHSITLRRETVTVGVRAVLFRLCAGTQWFSYSVNLESIFNRVASICQAFSSPQSPSVSFFAVFLLLRANGTTQYTDVRLRPGIQRVTIPFTSHTFEC